MQARKQKVEFAEISYLLGSMAGITILSSHMVAFRVVSLEPWQDKVS